jgi:hypothetical protein
MLQKSFQFHVSFIKGQLDSGKGARGIWLFRLAEKRPNAIGIRGSVPEVEPEHNPVKDFLVLEYHY